MMRLSIKTSCHHRVPAPPCKGRDQAIGATPALFRRSGVAPACRAAHNCRIANPNAHLKAVPHAHYRHRPPQDGLSLPAPAGRCPLCAIAQCPVRPLHHLRAERWTKLLAQPACVHVHRQHRLPAHRRHPPGVVGRTAARPSAALHCPHHRQRRRGASRRHHAVRLAGQYRRSRARLHVATQCQHDGVHLGGGGGGHPVLWQPRKNCTPANGGSPGKSPRRIRGAPGHAGATAAAAGANRTAHAVQYPGQLAGPDQL